MAVWENLPTESTKSMGASSWLIYSKEKLEMEFLLFQYNILEKKIVLRYCGNIYG